MGELVLQIPWSNLRNKPVKVHIENVYLIAASNFDSYRSDPEDDEKRAQAVKLMKLDKFEMKADSIDLVTEDAVKQQSFTEALVNKIVDNLQITIKNIHVRFQYPTETHPFALGFTLQELSAVSTNENWEPAFVESSIVTHKLATLKSLAFYWNSDSQEVDDINSPVIVDSIKSAQSDFQYIMQPVSGVGHITLNKDPKAPATQAQLIFDDLGFVLDDEQYKDILQIAEVLRQFNLSKEYIRFRPLKNFEEDPAGWIRYAGQVVLYKVHKKREQWTWDYLLARRKDRLRYIQLYNMGPKSLTGNELEEFNELEKKYSFEDLKFFRKLAKAEQKENKQMKEQTQTVPASKSWTSWIWGSGSNDQTKEIAGEKITEEQEKEFYDAIEWDDNKTFDGNKDSISMSISTILKTGSFTLRNFPHAAKPQDIVHTLFNGFKLDFDLRNGGNSYLADLSLDELRIDDMYPESLFKHVVTVKSLSDQIVPQFEHCHTDDTEEFFRLIYENDPLDGQADANLTLKTKSMTIFYNKFIIENIVRFFTPQKLPMFTVDALLNAAGKTVGEISNITRIGLEYAIEQHKTVNVKMDIQAPLIIVPLDTTILTSPCAILDAGHISVESNLADKDLIAKIQDKTQEQDLSTLESLVYDKFKVSLHHTQFMVGANLRETMRQLNSGNPEASSIIMDKLNFDFLVEVSIMPTAHNITKFKASGNLPLISGAISDAKYHLLMEIINTSIPNFNFEFQEDFEKYSFDLESENDSTYNDSFDDSSTLNSAIPVTGPDDRQLLEFNFNIDKVQLTLNKTTSAETLAQEPLIGLSLNAFCFNLKLREDQIKAHCSLRDISVDDFIQKISPGELTKVVTSIGQVNSETKNDLLNVSFLQKMDTGDQDITLVLSTLKFVITPKTLLTLKEFARVTFSDPSPESSQVLSPLSSTLSHSEVNEIALPVIQPSSGKSGKLNLQIDLHSVIVVLNDDGFKLATLKLEHAHFMMQIHGDDLALNARLGHLSLTDNSKRQLISLQGDNLAELSYKTENSSALYNSSVFFRAGSLCVTLFEEPMTRLLDFGARFAQMKVLYDAAAEAAVTQAKQIDNPGEIMFDVLISTPIVVIPVTRPNNSTKPDTLTAYLGDIFARNEFNAEGTKIIAGLRSIHLASEISQVHHKILSDLDLAFDVLLNSKTGGTNIKGFLSELNMKLSDLQIGLLMDAATAVPRMFSSNSKMDESQLNEIGQELGLQENLEALGLLSENINTSSDNRDEDKLNLSFEAQKVSTTLYHHTKDVKSDEELENFSLTSVSLNGTKLSLKMKNDGNLWTDLTVKSLTIQDTRKLKDNKFPDIIPASIGDSGKDQFICQMSLTEANDTKKLFKTNLEILNPTVILAVDYLVALKFFVDDILPASTDTSRDVTELATIDENDEYSPQGIYSSSSASTSKLEIEYSAKLVEPSIVLLADPKLSNTEAIVFKVESILVGQLTNVLQAKISNVGMFMCHMDNFYQNRLRIIDDFSISSVVDMSSESGVISKIDVACDALVLRISVRDIVLVRSIINRATEMAFPENGKDDTEVINNSEVRSIASNGSSALTSRRRSSIAKHRRSSAASATGAAAIATLKPFFQDQHLLAAFDGIRVVIVGALHEVPMIDFYVKPFTVTAQNWSSAGPFLASVEVNSYANIFSYEKSAWEPLFEPWKFTVDAKRKELNSQMKVEVRSDQKAELTITSLTFGTIQKALEILNEKAETLDKKIKKSALYTIINQTGFDIEVWDESKENIDSTRTLIKESGSQHWNFFDWHTMRENLSAEIQKNELGIRIKGSPFNPLRNVSVSTVGEKLYRLEGKEEGQLVCEVILSGLDKRVILRAPLTFENKTQAILQLSLNPSDPNSPIWDINPGESRSVPITHSALSTVSVRPDAKYQFGWCESPVNWQNLYSGPKSIYCVSQVYPTVRFFIQVAFNDSTSFKRAASSNLYPGNIKVILSPPVQITNLLPYDLTYRIYDKKMGRDWKNTLRAGESSAVHVVDTARLLLLSVRLDKEAGYDRSDFAVINTVPSSNDFSREHKLCLRSPSDGQKLYLNLHYLNEKKKKNCDVQIYAPYLILNRTLLDVSLKTRSNTALSKVNIKKEIINGEEVREINGHPKMWSFDTTSASNRVTLKIGNSQFSEPLSLDNIGKHSEVVIRSESGNKSIYLGLSVIEGEGKYFMTKIVNLDPRFIVHNELDKNMYLRDTGSNTDSLVRPGDLFPIHFIQDENKRQLLVSFDQTHWSAPFNIENVGSTYLRTFDNSTENRVTLLNIETVLDGARLFIHVENSSKCWPYSIHNGTDYAFTIRQAAPPEQPNLKPTVYDIAPESVTPYSFDYPSSSLKELILSIEGIERNFQFAEIGTLLPFKIQKDNGINATFDLSVVADGPIQALIISPYDETLNLSETENQPTKQNSTKITKKPKDEGKVSLLVKVKLAGLGISLINKQMKELCYISVEGVKLKYRVSEVYDTFTCKLDWIQIDNQLDHCIYPILLYPSVIRRDEKELKERPTFSGSISRVRDDSYGVLYIKYATVLLQEISVQVDEEFIYAFVDFIEAYQNSLFKTPDKLCPKELNIPMPLKGDNGENIYFEVLHLQPAQMDLSFTRTTETSNDDGRATSRNPIMFFFNVLTMAIGNINDAPLRLNALMIENIRVPTPTLANSIATHYSENFFAQIYTLIGSADVLGNPVGLFNNMSSGIVDLFYEPYQGLIMHESPSEFGIGLAKGGISFLNKSVFGISDSVSKFTGSLSKGLSFATMDHSYQARRNIARTRNRPTHALAGIGYGANSFVEGIASGVTGLATAPLEGATKEGTAGFFKGIGKGLIGLPTKTAIGVLDFASNLSEGVKNTTNQAGVTPIKRLRPPRFVPADGIVRPYNFAASEAQIWLHAANGGRFSSDEYLTHIALDQQNEKIVMVTYSRIFLLNTKNLTTQWEVPYRVLKSITMQPTGLELGLKDRIKGPFVPLPDQNARRELYKCLEIAVSKYNEQYQT